MENKRREYIARHKSLFWYTPEEKLYNISDSLLVDIYSKLRYVGGW